MALEEHVLLKILKEEEQDASAYYDSELAEIQAEAMRRYHAQPYGVEREGRSQVVTHDVEDTINWMLPKLMRTFLASDEMVSVEDEASDDEDMAASAAKYLSHVYFKDNRGAQNLHDWTFDGLLQRIGVHKVCWEDPKPKPPKEFEGLDQDQLAEMMQDPSWDILEAEVNEETGLISIKAQHVPKVGRVVIEVVPPEEFAFSRRAKSGRECDYKRRKREVFLGDLIEQMPEKKAALQSIDGTANADDDEETDSDARRYERFPDEPSNQSKSSSDHVARRKVWLVEEEIRIDFDGDGIVELRSIKRVGDVILDNIEIETTEYHDWSPIRVSHRMAGRSIADTLVDIQRIRTDITRLALDGLSQALVVRTAVDRNQVHEEGVDALYDADIGGVIPTKGNPNEIIMPLATPDVSAAALTMLEYWDQRSEEASGVTRHSQGLAPQAITDTMGGIQALQAAANERIELVALWMKYGLEDVFNAIHRMLAAYQDQPRTIKVAGKPIAIDPRQWSEEMSVSIHVGTAAEDRATKLANLGMIAAKQEQILQVGGPSNPIVTMQQYRDTLALMAEVMGFKDSTRFFAEVPDEWQPPKQGEDPKAAEMQAKLQIEQQKAQADAQLQQQKAQFDTQLRQAEFAEKTKMEQIRAQTDREIAQLKMQSEREIAEMRIMAEQAIARERMAAEMDLARWKASKDAELARERNTMQTNVAAEKVSGSNGTGKGYRPGGDISK